MKKNADTANAAASAESVSTQITAVQKQIVAVEQEIKLVSLGEPRTTTAANGSIVYDLSALNMVDYRAFLVFATVDAAGTGVSDQGQGGTAVRQQEHRTAGRCDGRPRGDRRVDFSRDVRRGGRLPHTDAEPKRQLSRSQRRDFERQRKLERHAEHDIQVYGFERRKLCAVWIESVKMNKKEDPRGGLLF